MQLTCHKCHHCWEDDLDEGTPVVQCPECMVVVPMALAKRAPASDYHDEKTVVAGASEPTVVQRTPASARDATKTAFTPFEQTHISDMPTPPPMPGVPEPVAPPPPPPPPPSTPKSSAPPVSHFDVTGVGPGVPDPPPADAPAPPLPSFLDSRSEPTEAADPPVPPPAPAQAAGTASAAATATGGGPVKPVSQQSKSLQSARAKDVNLSGMTVAGYEIKSMLGAGGMGAVALARQKSLDRDVALKILPGGLATNPDFLARFTREALSAAQLNHHNVIQVFDVGSDSDVHYISMEFVSGKNLGDIVRDDGKLSPDDAAGYVLQAARGLKYAHERGIIHRDIKPDNLMLNDLGIVKIADMGLAKMKGEAETAKSGKKEFHGLDDPELKKIARGDLTLQSVAMGTPSYMPPEQAKDAGSVDHRADQYSLGCTLFYLIAGKPPYSGSTAFEIISKHMSEPLPPLEGEVKAMPGTLSTIISKMTSKRPDDRYASMDEVIRDLEAYLGVESDKGTYTPREHHMELLEREQKNYYASPRLRLRKLVQLGFFAGMTALMFLSLFTINAFVAGAFLGLLVMTPVFNFIADGILHKTYHFRRVRSVFFGMSLKGWASTVGGAIAVIAALYVLGLLWPWLAVAVIAAGLAAAYQYQVIRPLRQDRSAPLSELFDMLKQLRVRGVPEDALQDFVCRFSGEHWEEMFEELFGYEAMLIARGKIAKADKVKLRKKFAVWRDPIARWLDEVELSRKQRRERKQLEKVEAQRLKAQGVSEKDAQKQAQDEATKVLTDLKIKETVAAGPSEIKHAGRKYYDKTALDQGLQFLRLIAGAVVLVLFASNMLGAIPGMAQVQAIVASLPVPQGMLQLIYSWFGLGAGAALLVSGFSARRFTGFAVLAGAVVFFLSGMIAGLASAADVTQENVVHAACVLMAAGVAWAFAARMSGRQF